MKQLLPALPRI